MEKTEHIAEIIAKLSVIEKAASENDKCVLIDACRLLDELLQIENRRIEEEKKPISSHTRWSDEEASLLKEEYLKGMSVEELAAKHGRSYFGIISRLTKLGLLKESDVNGKKRWSAEEETRLKEGFASGKSLGTLSAVHGRSMAGIVGRLIKLGIINNE